MTHLSILPPVDAPILDTRHLHTLQEISDNKNSLIEELLSLFKDSIPAVLLQLKTTIEKNDRDTIRHLAHRLKGSAANIGAQQLAAQCAQLENDAKREDTIINQESYEYIEQIYNKSLYELACFLESGC